MEEELLTFEVDDATVEKSFFEDEELLLLHTFLKKQTQKSKKKCIFLCDTVYIRIYEFMCLNPPQKLDGSVVHLHPDVIRHDRVNSYC